jgi:hypothetical protein
MQVSDMLTELVQDHKLPGGQGGHRPDDAEIQTAGRLVHTQEVIQAAQLVCNATSVPSLFRLTLTSATKRREPMRAEIPDQRHDRRYHDRRQKFELYHDM